MDRTVEKWELQTVFALRYRILMFLYETFRAYPYADIELREIETRCDTDTATLNWNMVYLEKSGLLELGKSAEAPPYVACSASISAAGIDLVEDVDRFRRRFPPEPEKNEE